jgi:UDP-N-acetylglucosamine diphosphorylase/glucosamine-1-phosphate N-acetyltransferase
VKGNAERIAADVARLWEPGDAPGVVRIGDGAISLAEGAEIEPGVHVDTRGGPVRLAEGVRVEGPARLVGPLYVGPGSRILGGQVGTSSIGPVCLVRGEVADSVFLGFVNKAHDGYIGHAMLGRWVNLGAFTTNSDLKNNYRPVHVWTPDGDVDTGLLKVGCFLGDHVKSGIGTVLNTGTVIGAGSNVFGGLMPPAVVPPFSWGTGPDLRDHNLDKFLGTAERAMARRSQELTPGQRRILEEAWEATAGRRAQGS